VHDGGRCREEDGCERGRRAIGGASGRRNRCCESEISFSLIKACAVEVTPRGVLVLCI
jgi:hypothetical protein